MSENKRPSRCAQKPEKYRDAGESGAAAGWGRGLLPGITGAGAAMALGATRAKPVPPTPRRVTLEPIALENTSGERDCYDVDGTADSDEAGAEERDGSDGDEEDDEDKGSREEVGEDDESSELRSSSEEEEEEDEEEEGSSEEDEEEEEEDEDDDEFSLQPPVAPVARAKAPLVGSPATSRLPPREQHSLVRMASKILDKGEPYMKYDEWPLTLLQKLCTKRGIKGMSKQKDRGVLATSLQKEDTKRGRRSPHVDDLKDLAGGGTPVQAKGKKPGSIPAGAVLSLRRAMGCGLSNPTGEFSYDGGKYQMSDILDIIEKEDAAERGSVKAATPVVSRKGKHCVFRLLTIMVQREYRGDVIESRLGATRHELDVKQTGAKRGIWPRLADAYCDAGYKVPRLLDDDLVADLDPNIIGQPDASPQKLYDMFHSSGGNWNRCNRNYKGVSGNHGEWSDFVQNNRDTYVFGLIVKLYPELDSVCSNLLPEVMRREDDGTGGGSKVTGKTGAKSDEKRRADAKKRGQLEHAPTSGAKKKRQAVRANEMERASGNMIKEAMAEVKGLFHKPPSTPASSGPDWSNKMAETDSRAAAMDLSQSMLTAHTKFRDELAVELAKQPPCAMAIAFIKGQINKLEEAMKKDLALAI